jgi:hypothetical protein
MAPKKAVPEPRYTLERVATEIEEQIRRRGRGSQKDAAIGIGLSEQAFSHKQTGTHSNWSVEELGRLATYWKAPVGWPWVPWDEGEALDALRRMSRAGGPGSP